MSKIRLNESKLRIILFLAVGLLHVALLFFVVFQVEKIQEEREAPANLISLVDVQEEIPPPPEPPPEVFTNTYESIAETMIETDEEPDGTVYENVLPAQAEVIEYVPMSRVTDLPRLPEDQIRRAVVYPPIALRSNVEGSVYLELFVDRQGNIRSITILREDPEDRGFGEAAVNALNGIKADRPAQINGEPVAVRFRHRMVFTLK